MSKTSHITAERVVQSIRGRFNPLRNITPQKVVRYIEEFRLGRLREVAWAMECVEETDDTLKAVAPKRKKSVSRLSWDIVEVEGASKEFGEELVEKQRKALLHFYNNVRSTSAVDRNIRGGLQCLIRQMMDAVGKRYSVHEIAWSSDKTGQLTAQFTHVPLWFFENTEGELKFLYKEGSSEGKELERNGWMVTVGEGLMIACLVAYIYKSLPMKDWLTYSERNGMPVFMMATEAAYGTKEWNEAVEMVQSIASEFAGVRSKSTEFDVQDLKGGGELPYPKLVERMDRAMASLWRGSDLSTMSGEDKLGASLQQGETDILEDDDVDNINETFNSQVDPVVLNHIFGTDAPHCVYFALKSPDRLDETAEMNKIKSAVELGAKVPVSYVHERFNIPAAKDGDEILRVSTAAIPDAGYGVTAANSSMENNTALAALASARANDFMPVRVAIAKLEQAQTPEEFKEALDNALQVTTQNALGPISEGATAMVLERLISDSLVEGAIDQSTHAR